MRDPREGILGPRSVGWQLGADLGLFLGGGRAALLQLAHPMVAHAIDHHSRTRSDVAGRFQRTFRNVFAMIYGELDDACTAARRVHAVHTRITGTFANAIGGWPAGTTYHANDVDALRWVHATLVDTTIVVRELLDGPVEVARKDAYMIELQRFGALFGIPRATLPASWAEHAAYMTGMLASDRIVVAPFAREMGRFLVGRGDSAQPPLGRIAEAVTHALLPPHLAEQFELRGAPRRTRAGLAAFAMAYRMLPRRAVAIPAAADARNRLAGRG
ncbi:MAG: oxygenase MpaB family protein, partial [Kofleriaceae bacterium]